MTEADVLALFERCSNRGRWGPDDELGTLNHITAETRVAAARLVTSGRTVGVACEDPPADAVPVEPPADRPSHARRR